MRRLVQDYWLLKNIRVLLKINAQRIILSQYLLMVLSEKVINESSFPKYISNNDSKIESDLRFKFG